MTTAAETGSGGVWAAELPPAVYEKQKFGMWLFLVTEVLFFSGLFLLYLAYRSRHPEGFRAGATQMHVLMGSFNTFVLLTSSATAAMALTELRQGRPRRSVGLQVATLLLGLIFLAVKYQEWKADIFAGFYPGSPAMAGRSPGEIDFCSLSYMMTGIHGLHVFAGLVLFGVCIVRSRDGRITAERFALLENSTLFWHLVDMIWIYLWPLLYLIR